MRLRIPPERYRELHGVLSGLGGKSVVLTGPGPVEAYLAAGYWAVLAGVGRLAYKGPASEPVLELPVAAGAGREEKRWLRTGKGREATAEMLAAPREDGKWAPEELRCGTAAVLPGGAEVLRASGRGAVAMYANLGCSAALAGFREVLVEKPQVPYAIRIGADGESGMGPRRAGGKRGIAVGILGDPNSGKSVFARALDAAVERMRPAWMETWMYDCDMACPTPDWFRRGYLTGDRADEEEREALRCRFKAVWDKTGRTEAICARDLAVLRTNLDLVVADMPGGRHPQPGHGGAARPERIPTPARGEMMRQCDAFVVLCRGDGPAVSDAIFEGWRAALAEYGLEKRIVARIESREPGAEFAAEGFAQGEDGIVRGTVRGLDRRKASAELGRGLAEGAEPLLRLLFALGPAREARGAVALSFLTGNKGTRYGAAARSAESGRVFRAGQYSSFNHSTNIHAEMNVLAHAATAGDPDVDVLAVAWTGNGVGSPCGVCRQVMAEHARRTGRDFDVALVPASGPPLLRRVSELLPLAWTPRSAGRGEEKGDCRTAGMEEFAGGEGACIPGAAFVETAVGTGRRLLGMVWDEAFKPGVAIAKFKYEDGGPDGAWRKLPHSFSEAAAYRRTLGGLRAAMPGFPGLAAVRSGGGGFWPPVPLPDAEAELFGNGLFTPAGIDAAGEVRLTGSRMLGLEREGSDWDLVVRASPEQIAALRGQMAAAIRNGKASLPEESGSLRLLGAMFPGGVEGMLREGRWADAFVFAGRRVSLMFVPPGPAEPLLAEGGGVPVRECVCGRIEDARKAPYKRSQCVLCAEDGRRLRLVCYHKTGNLLREGDRIAAAGLFLPGPDGFDGTLLLASLSTDSLVWLPSA